MGLILRALSALPQALASAHGRGEERPDYDPVSVPLLRHPSYTQLQWVHQTQAWADSCFSLSWQRSNLLKDLKPRLQKWNPHQVIGDIFVQMVTTLLYSVAWRFELIQVVTERVFEGVHTVRQPIQ